MNSHQHLDGQKTFDFNLTSSCTYLFVSSWSADNFRSKSSLRYLNVWCRRMDCKQTYVLNKSWKKKNHFLFFSHSQKKKNPPSLKGILVIMWEIVPTRINTFYQFPNSTYTLVTVRVNFTLLSSTDTSLLWACFLLCLHRMWVELDICVQIAVERFPLRVQFTWITKRKRSNS